MTMGPSIPGWTTVVHAEDGVDTNTITDSASTNTVLVVTGLLLAFGVGMAMLTVWYWRSTHPDPEALGPLVSMSRRGFDKLDPIEQRRQLDQLRPGLEPAADVEESVLPEMLPPIDLSDEPVADIAETTESTTTIESTEVGSGEISWDDDEWPDPNDWGELDVVDFEEEEFDDDSIETEPPTQEPSPRPNRPIDPLLG